MLLQHIRIHIQQRIELLLKRETQESVFGMDMNSTAIQESFLVQDINEVKYFGVSQQGHCDCPMHQYEVSSSKVYYYKTYLGNDGSIYKGGYSCWNMTIYTSE